MNRLPERTPITGAKLALLALLLVSIGVPADTRWSREWPATDFGHAAIDLGEIRSGGPPKDGIPAVDSPHFAPHGEVDWLDSREPVIALVVGGEARAYPIQILMYHEIVNDTIAGEPVSVTFCPLCNASIVFRRTVGEEVLDFGTTGKLRKSDLVMYDRQTESWWQQFTGAAIVGAMTGTVLERLPAQIVAYEEFRNAYPEGLVLSRETGFSRPYGRNPYRGYDRIGDQPFLFDDPVDPRLPAMERVVNVTIDGIHRVYPFAVFADEPVINDDIAGVPIVLLSRAGTLSALDESVIAGSRTIPSVTAWRRQLGDRILSFQTRGGEIRDRETGSAWNLLGQAVAGPLAGEALEPAPGGEHFAFAWLAFNPDSEIYGQ